jgi:hypothetical protein
MAGMPRRRRRKGNPIGFLPFLGASARNYDRAKQVEEAEPDISG